MSLGKRQQQKEDTKNRIVTGAYKVFAENGFAVPTSDIAEEINVSHGTIFVHFPTRDDLLIYVLEDFGSKIGTRLHELTEKSENIHDVLKAHLDTIKEYEGFYTRLITEKHLLPKEVQNTFVSIQSVIAFHFNKVAEKEIPEDYFDKLSLLHMVFNTWIGLVHYYLQNSDIFAPNSSVIEKYSDELINSFLNLIKR